MEAFQIRINPTEFQDAETVATQGAERFPMFSWAVANEPMGWPPALSDDEWLAQDWINGEREARGLPLPLEEVRHEAPSAAGSAAPAGPSSGPAAAPDFWAERAPELLEIGKRLLAVREVEAATGARAAEVKLGLTFTATREELAAVLLANAEAVEKRGAPLLLEASRVAAALAAAGGSEVASAPEPAAPPPARRGKAKKAAAEAAAEAAPREASESELASGIGVGPALLPIHQQGWMIERAARVRAEAAQLRFMAAHLPAGPFALGVHDVHHLFETAGIV